MTVRIEELCPATEKLYRDLLKSVPCSLVYHSLQYRNVLRQVIPDAKDRYLLAFDDERLAAALPAFVKPGPFGAVVNSLPFFGSHGSILAKKTCKDTVVQELLSEFDRMCYRENAVTSTIIENPFETKIKLSERYRPDLTDERIGQVTPLPPDAPSHEIEYQLLYSFHAKTRRFIRKGKKAGFEIHQDGDESTLRQLHEVHESNMKAIGARYKPWSVFRAIQQNFKYDRDYRVYSAKTDGQFAAGLLIFYFNHTAEYFVPVIHPQFRSEQPLSYLIFIAMQDAISKGINLWNWGGTWLSQNGVYHFKSQWGTREFKYEYYIKVHANIGELKKQSSADILDAYPYTYVLPFSELNL